MNPRAGRDPTPAPVRLGEEGFAVAVERFVLARAPARMAGQPT